MNIPTQEELPEGLEYTNLLGLDGLYEISEASNDGLDEPKRFRIFAIGKDGTPVNHFVKLSASELQDEAMLRTAKDDIEQEFRRLMA